MRVIRLLAALLCALLLTVPASAASAVSAGYLHGSGAASRNYTPADLPAGLLTHVNYAFAGIDPDTGTLILQNPSRDLENLSGLRAQRESYPELKLIIAVGGWDGSIYFSDVASTAARREVFAQSCLDLMLEQDLDGIDINWEYPVSGGAEGIIHRPEDKQNFTLLLQAIRSKLDQQEAIDGREYCLTATGAAGVSFLKKIEPAAVAEIVDYIFLMAYDYSGSWAEKTGFNAPMDGVQKSAKAYIEGGVPAEKLVLGMPLYGHRYLGASTKNNGLGGSFDSAFSITYDAVVKDYLGNSDFRLYRDTAAASPYLFGGNTFISYDDPESIAAKASFAKELGLAGVGFWEVSQDRNGVLMQSAWDAFTGSSSGLFSDVLPDRWYTDAIEQAAQAGWMTGTAAHIFSPDAPLTRGMFAAILHRMEGEPAADAAPFPDAAGYCAAATAWAAGNGIVTGYADGTFRPDTPITREQMAAMLFRYAQYQGCDTGAAAGLANFRDADRVHPYAQEAMAWAVDTGLMQGRSDTQLVPDGTATRAETAVILARYAEKFS